MTKKKGYSTLAEVTSSDGRDTWTVAATPKGGFSCNCPSWIFRPICGECGTVLEKRKNAEVTQWWCPECHGYQEKACKHIRAYLAEERKGGVPSDRSEGLVRLLLRAAKDEAVLDRLNEWQWRAIASRLLPSFQAGGEVEMPTLFGPLQEGRPIRHIVLPD